MQESLDLNRLMIQAKSGDKRSFVNLYAATCPDIFVLCRAMVKNDESASRTVREVYIALSEELSSLSDDTDVKERLVILALKLSVRSLEKDGVDILTDIGSGFSYNPEEVDPVSYPAVYAEDADRKRKFLEAFDSLGLVLRQAVSLVYYYGFKPFKAAEIAGCDEYTIEKRLYLASKTIDIKLAMNEKSSNDPLYYSHPEMTAAPEVFIRVLSDLKPDRETQRSVILEVFSAINGDLDRAEQSSSGEESPALSADTAENVSEEKTGKSAFAAVPVTEQPPASSEGADSSSPIEGGSEITSPVSHPDISFAKNNGAGAKKISPEDNPIRAASKEKRKKNSRKKVIMAILAVIMVVGFAAAAIMLSEIFHDGTDAEEETTGEPLLSTVSVSQVPKGLDTFLTSFCSYTCGEGGNEFDKGSFNSGKENLLYYLAASYPCVNYEDYSLEAPSLVDDGSVDPWYYASDSLRYTVTPTESVEWAAKNVFGCSNEEYAELLQDGQDNKLFYTYNTSIYSLDAAAEFKPTLVEISGVKTDGSRFFVTYNRYVASLLETYFKGGDYTSFKDFDKIRNIIRHDTLYAVMEYVKDDNGKAFWKILANSASEGVFDSYSYDGGNIGAENLFQSLPTQFILTDGDTWKTIVNFNDDGTFRGYHTRRADKECGPGYSYTEYVCGFSGKFGKVVQKTNYFFAAELIVLTTDEDPGEVTKEDNYMRKTTDPIGFETGVGTMFAIYTKGTQTGKVYNDLLRSLNTELKWNGKIPDKLDTCTMLNLSDTTYGFYAPKETEPMPEDKASGAWKNAYKTFLSERQYLEGDEEYLDNISPDHNLYRKAALYYADGGTPYLIISSAISSQPTGTHIYCYKNHVVTYVGSAGSDLYTAPSSQYPGLFAKTSVYSGHVEPELAEKGIQYYDLWNYADLTGNSFKRSDVLRVEHYDYSGASTDNILSPDRGLGETAAGDLEKLSMVSIYELLNSWDAYTSKGDENG